MSIINIKKCLVASALLLLMGSAAQAGTLLVNCAGKGGFNSVGAASRRCNTPSLKVRTSSTYWVRATKTF